MVCSGQQQAPRLTDREQDVVQLLSEGLSNRQIGQRLDLSPLTVRNYISRLLFKFEARNRTELLAKIVTLRRYSQLIGCGERQQAPRLTDQERHIVRLIFEGLSNRQIGEKLYLSPLTVRNYISQLLSKFETQNRTELLAKVVALRRQYHRRLMP